MRLFSYIAINFLIILYLVIAFYKGIQSGFLVINLIIVSLIIVCLFNLIFFVIEKLLNKLLEYLIKIYDKRKMKNYNLYEWMGEVRWIKLLDEISNIKEFDKDILHSNYQLIKIEIEKEYDSKEKLNSLKMYLETIVESPRLTVLNTVTQTLLMALITTSIINFLNGIFKSNVNSMWYLAVVFVVWIILLVSIMYISKQIDRNKLFLKLVLDCISEKEVYKNITNYRYSKGRKNKL